MRNSLKIINKFTIDKTKEFLRKALLHEISDLGISPGHDIDSVIILRGAFKNERNDKLKSKFENALHRLICEIDNTLKKSPRDIEPNLVARLLILLQELLLFSDRRIIAGWAAIPYLKSIKSTEGNLHFIVLGTALRLGATIEREILEEDLQDKRFSATAVFALSRRSAKDGVWAFYKWFKNSSPKLSDITRIRMRETINLLHQEHGRKAIRDAFSSVIEKIKNTDNRTSENFSFFLKENGIDILTTFSKTPIISIAPPPLSQLKKEVLENHQLPFYYTGYSEGKLFDEKVEIPKIYNRFLNEFRSELKSTLNLPKDIQVLPKPLKINPHALTDFVYDMLQGRAIIPEVAFCSKERLKNVGGMVVIGKVKNLGIVVPKNLYNKIISHFDKEEFVNSNVNLGPLSEVFAYCINSNIRCLVQPPTDVQQEVSDLFNHFNQENETPLGTHIKRRPTKDDVNSIVEFNIIARELTYSKKKTIAFLDWIIAKQVQKLKPNTFKLLAVSYDVPLMAGYFYPKGDDKFRELLLKIVKKIYFPKKRWNKDLKKIMAKCQVALADEIKIVESDELDEARKIS